MKTWVKLMLLFLGFAVLTASHMLEANGETEAPDPDEVALWLARSCVGEAGFESARTADCATLLHIYAKRQSGSEYNLLEIAKKYSATIKRRKGHPRPWILDLNREATKPTRWDSTKSKWSMNKDLWIEVLFLCEDFLKGNVPDPYPDADHFGNDGDHWRAVSAGWYELDADLVNRIYSIDEPIYAEGVKLEKKK